VLVGRWGQLEGEEVGSFLLFFPKRNHASSSMSPNTWQYIRDNTDSIEKIPLIASLLPVVCA